MKILCEMCATVFKWWRQWLSYLFARCEGDKDLDELPSVDLISMHVMRVNFKFFKSSFLMTFVFIYLFYWTFIRKVSCVSLVVGYIQKSSPLKRLSVCRWQTINPIRTTSWREHKFMCRHVEVLIYWHGVLMTCLFKDILTIIQWILKLFVALRFF